jgi:hypothetical protein
VRHVVLGIRGCSYPRQPPARLLQQAGGTAAPGARCL